MAANYLDETLKIVALITLVVTIRRMQIARRDHLVNVYMKVFEKMDVARIREARRWLYGKYEEFKKLQDPNAPDGSWAIRQKIAEVLRVDKDARDKVEELIRAFDQLGLLVREGVVPINVLARFYASPALRCWYVLTPYILIQREDRTQTGHLWEWENLATRIIIKKLRSHGLWHGVSQHDDLEGWARDVRVDTSRPEFKRFSDQEYKPGYFPWKLRRYSLTSWRFELW